MIQHLQEAPLNLVAGDTSVMLQEYSHHVVTTMQHILLDGAVGYSHWTERVFRGTPTCILVPLWLACCHAPQIPTRLSAFRHALGLARCTLPVGIAQRKSIDWLAG